MGEVVGDAPLLTVMILVGTALYARDNKCALHIQVCFLTAHRIASSMNDESPCTFPCGLPSVNISLDRWTQGPQLHAPLSALSILASIALYRGTARTSEVPERLP